jgi:hypothetical protein
MPHDLLSEVLFSGVISIIGLALLSSLGYGVAAVVTSDPARRFWAWLRNSDGRGRPVVAPMRKAITQAAHGQQVRITLAELGPTGLTGADSLDILELRDLSRSLVEELGAALAATDDDPDYPGDPGDPDNPGRDRALACYDAAALLVVERDDELDLLGAIVLAREGQTALIDRDPRPLPVCQVHPLHGPALRRPRPGQRSRRPRDFIAVCAGCDGRSVAELNELALRAGGGPYYRAGGFWARVGFGALDAELPGRVLEYLGVE